ncbi:hypothetical protein B0T40_03255 [Chromobacterium haemolyticum]|uniref:hypothetical protein n=1 Tax=Chromobacterium haemolyticum TaxID=394935 RepID=UPI0009D9619F|nr:hypothetical protein [Chromobacterium haemolyticum]OQS39766.1 hypothetical protein B0T40_03255 [Chromobacterium haemolyticum]
MSQNQKPADLTEIKLSDDRVARIVPFKGKHIRHARIMMRDAGHDFLFALIAQTTTIDGHGIVPEDLDEMAGADVVKLQAAVEGN